MATKDTAARSAKKTENTPRKRMKAPRAPRFLRSFGGYFVGSFRELKQVKWPTRKMTWQLTGAVILFTIIMTLVITALDLGFEELVKRIIL